MRQRTVQTIVVVFVLSGASLAFGGPVGAAGPGNADGANSRAADHWTPERRAAATPRDLVLDPRGLAYLRGADGRLTPHGHATPAAAPGAGTADATGPSITDMNPASGATIGAIATFSAVVTDTGSGVRSVTVLVGRSGGSSQSFAASAGANDTWSVKLQGFTDGAWTWHVVAKDRAPRGGNTTTSAAVPFTVDTSSGGGGGGGGGDTGVITNAVWSKGGTVQTAAGRIYFEMPANRRQTRWNGYVCSGTVVTESDTQRSVVLTAAHCVYDDVYKVFARNVLFIPDQANTWGTGTDLNCGNDPLGCWTPSFGVVDTDWTTRTFPDNIPWDYGYYVVGGGAHEGTGSHDQLDVAAKSMAISFASPTTGTRTHALGYSYSEDPNLMYCAEAMGTEGDDNWWLPTCGLTGGSSGGPWSQATETDLGTGPVMSVNSWGYTNQPGMAGPKLSGSSASCLFDAARAQALATAGGITVC